MMAADVSSVIEIAALGRPLHLGMLYDCRKDAMIPGVTLWDMKTIEKDVLVKQQPKTHFQVIAEDRIKDKTSALNVSASLKASVLGGMVEVGGAAKYLNETKTSKQQARVTLQYSTTTKFEQLTMTHLGRDNISYKEIFDHNMATHVVTAVQYGAQAFFVFDREVSSSEKMKEIHGELKVAISKIPTVEIRGQGDLSMTKGDTCKSEKFSCTFCGDFALQNNPSTYEEAIVIYKSLPSLLGVDGENAIPLMVWLYPLSKLESKASQLVRRISFLLIEDVQDAMEELHEIDIGCNDLLTQPAALHFPNMKRGIQKFKGLCKQYRMAFQQDLARILPAVRGGGQEEGALVDILTTKDKSPFSSAQLSEFMESKQNEVNFVSGYMNLLTESKVVKIVASHLEMSQVLRDPKVEFVISLMFTSLREEEAFLSELNSWLRVKPLMEPTRVTSGEWFNDADVNKKSRVYVNEFVEFTKCNASNKKIQLVVSSVPDPTNPGVSIYLYEEGGLKDTAFHPPRPDTPKISQLSHDNVQLTCAPLPGGTDPVLSYRVEYRSRSDESWSRLEGEDTSDMVTVTGLSPNCLYQFRHSVVSARWVTLPSQPTHMIKTLPCSPPEKVTGQQDGPRGITLTWRGPGTIGAGTRISAYKVEFREEPTGAETWKEQLTGKKVEACTIVGVNPNSSYRFRVSAICGNAGSSSPSEEYVFRRDEAPGVWIRIRELRIILVGACGSGISATGNSILGRREFESSPLQWSVTRESQRGRCEYRGAEVTVVDTPGFIDTPLSKKEIRKEMARSLALSAPGPHAILLVLQVRTFNLEEWDAVRALQGLFGVGVEKHMMVVFTHKDHLEGESIESYVNDYNEDLGLLIAQCGGRYCAVDNTATGEEEEQQRPEVHDLILRTVEANNGHFYRK